MHVGPSQLAWLKPELTRPLGLVEDTVLIATPNAFVKEQLETRLRPLVIHALSRELGRPIQLAVTVDPRPASPQEPPSGPPSSPLSVMDQPGGHNVDADAPGHAAGIPRGNGAGAPHAGDQPQQRSRSARSRSSTPTSRPGGRRRAGQESTGWPSPGAQEMQPEQLTFNRPSQPSPPHQHESSDLSGHAIARPAVAAALPARAARAGPPGPIGAAARAAAPPGLRAPQLQVHVRDVRHRQQQPVRARGRRRGRRGPRQGLQPAVHLRRLGPGEDAPAARDRPLRPDALQRHQGALRELGGVHQRLHQHDPRRQAGRVPPQVPRCRRAPGRRHPVPGEQGRNPGGVFPHLQHTAQREQADRHLLRPGAQAPGDPGGPAAQPVRVGAADRRAAARARDPDRDPPQEGDPGRA